MKSSLLVAAGELREARVTCSWSGLLVVVAGGMRSLRMRWRVLGSYLVAIKGGERLQVDLLLEVGEFAAQEVDDAVGPNRVDAGEEDQGAIAIRAPQPGQVADVSGSRRDVAAVRGEHPKVVQELLGHAQVSITLGRDSHMTPRLMSNASVVLDRLLDEEA